MRFKDIASPEFPVAESEANLIMHIALPIGKNILMANDVLPSMGKTHENENRSKISINQTSKVFRQVGGRISKGTKNGKDFTDNLKRTIEKKHCLEDSFVGV